MHVFSDPMVLPISWGYHMDPYHSYFYDGNHFANIWYKKIQDMFYNDLKEYFQTIGREINIDLSSGAFSSTAQSGNIMFVVLFQNGILGPHENLSSMLQRTQTTTALFINYLKYTRLL